MTVYFVTGKLGSGKTLAAVGRIKDYLLRGSPVASNLDINLDSLLGSDKKNTNLTRIPDKPTVDDLDALGVGNALYDESKNGLIVLDECGTWFNSRSWNDKSRQALINWFLHARKLGWDIIFIIQNIQIVDKQARLALCEYMVCCKRADRFFKIPFIEPMFKALSGSALPKPQFHVGIVKYGDSNDSLTVDRWWYRGSDLYDAYDTKQVFTDNYDDGVYRVLPAYYTHGRYQVARTKEFYMRLTKIYWKRFSRPAMLCVGMVFGGLVAMSHYSDKMTQQLIDLKSPITSDFVDDSPVDVIPSVVDDVPDSRPVVRQVVEDYSHPMKGFVVTGQAFANGKVLYMTVGNGVEQYSINELKASGYGVRVIDECRVRIISDGVPYVAHSRSCAAKPIASEQSLAMFYSQNLQYADPSRDYSRSE